MNVYYLYMMNNIFLVSSITSVLYFLLSFLKIKYVDKDDLVLKKIVLNTLIVAVCSYIAFYVVFNYNLGDKNILKEVKETPAFTGEPGF
jgi:hypothetical protein